MSRSVALIDTSVLCELLGIPGKSNEAENYREQLDDKVSAEESLLLPVTSILETGNHIGQCSQQGNIRRDVAQSFVAVVLEAVEGKMPFRPTRFFEPEEMRKWLAGLPDWVARSDGKGKGSGLGDLSIQKEWEYQCRLNPGRRVYIWSMDQHLSSYDRPPDV